MKKPIITTTGLYNAIALSVLLVFAGCKGGQSEQQGTGTAVDKETEMVTEEQKDMGTLPWVLDIEEATIANSNYRVARWSGKNLQMVLMSLKPGEKIDPEVHENHDQFIRIEQGEARVLMGKTEHELTYDKTVSDDWSVFIPAGYWHELWNIGKVDLKLYTIYAPGEHPEGTTHKTYQEAQDYHH